MRKLILAIALTLFAAASVTSAYAQSRGGNQGGGPGNSGPGDKNSTAQGGGGQPPR